MMPSAFTIYIVEDDGSVRDALSLLLGVHGFSVAMFADAESFLSAFSPRWSGCLLVDIRMPGMDGLSLQQELRRRNCELPVIIMTGHGDVESARVAFRANAIDFLEKPIDQNKLLAAIDEAVLVNSRGQREAGKRESFRALMSNLTQREREVMDLVVAGRHNREIAALLGISARTVEVHKARMMAKLSVENVADLVRLTLGT